MKNWLGRLWGFWQARKEALPSDPLAELAEKGFAVTWMNGDVTYFIDEKTFNSEDYMRLSEEDKEELNRLIKENQSFHYKDMTDPYQN